MVYDAWVPIDEPDDNDDDDFIDEQEKLADIRVIIYLEDLGPVS